MLLNLMAIDPGGRTGLAHVIVPKPNKLVPHMAVREAIVDTNLVGQVITIDGLLDSQTAQIVDHMREAQKKSGHGRQQAYEVRNVIAIEGFRLHPKANLENTALIPVRLAAKLEFYIWLEELPWEVVWQWPSDMQAVPDDALRRWSMWMKGKGNKDARAALKHLIVLARKELAA